MVKVLSVGAMMFAILVSASCAPDDHPKVDAAPADASDGVGGSDGSDIPIVPDAPAVEPAPDAPGSEPPPAPDAPPDEPAPDAPGPEATPSPDVADGPPEVACVPDGERANPSFPTCLGGRTCCSRCNEGSGYCGCSPLSQLCGSGFSQDYGSCCPGLFCRRLSLIFSGCHATRCALLGERCSPADTNPDSGGCCAGTVCTSSGGSATFCARRPEQACQADTDCALLGGRCDPDARHCCAPAAASCGGAIGCCSGHYCEGNSCVPLPPGAPLRPTP